MAQSATNEKKGMNHTIRMLFTEDFMLLTQMVLEDANVRAGKFAYGRET
jgi:hypothetical protein